MGKSRTPKYAVELVHNNQHRTTSKIAWEKHYGRATNNNLAKLITSIENSFKPGGANQHIKPETYISASIINQETGRLKAFYAKDGLDV